MEKFKTEQEIFWAGDFGNNYIKRNDTKELLAAKIGLFASILKKTEKIDSCVEFGANIGLNLISIQTLIPKCNVKAVEINKNACEEMNKIGNIEVINKSILDFEINSQSTLAFTMGVLIHLDPNTLESVYEKLYNASSKYILVAEYYNPSPVEIEYRGNKGKLFKRDFAGEIMDKYPELKLVDYGFAYHRDNLWPHDDITWFLLSK